MISGIILAGGRSKRMGVNKALLPMGNLTMIEQVAAILKKVVNDVMVIANTPRDYSFLDLPMYMDIIPGMGVLGGIYTGLIKSKTDYNLIVACDMPFLDPSFLKYMLSVSDNSNAVVPVADGGYQPLCSVYSKNCIPVIEERMEKNQLKVMDLFEHVKIKEIDVREVKGFENKDQMFFNLNTKEEYEHSLKVLNL